MRDSLGPGDRPSNMNERKMDGTSNHSEMEKRAPSFERHSAFVGLRDWLIRNQWSYQGASNFCQRLHLFHDHHIQASFRDLPVPIGVAARRAKSGESQILVQIQIPLAVGLQSKECSASARNIGEQVRESVRVDAERDNIVLFEYVQVELEPFASTLVRLTGERDFEFFGVVPGHGRSSLNPELRHQ